MRIAAHLVEAKPDRMVFADGKISAKDSPKKSIAFGQAVSVAYVAKTLPADMEPGLEATTFFEPSNFTYPFGTHICVVEIDSETGDVKLVRYVAVDDCGNVINPLLVEGQVQGGIVQSVGQAIFEEAVYDRQTGRMLNPDMEFYRLAGLADVGKLKVHMMTGPGYDDRGVIGLGEPPVISPGAAISNAVANAIGVRVPQWPMSPMNVLNALAKEGKA